MAETLSTLSIISFAIAGVCLVLAAFFWFFFKIPIVIGDLTGRTARKSIAKMRATNERNGVKGYKESKTNAARGKVTGTISDTEKQKKNRSADQRPETGLLAENQEKRFVSEETGMLVDESTELLDSGPTELLIDEEATALLDNPVPKQERRIGGKELMMIDEVMLIHTDEILA